MRRTILLSAAALIAAAPLAAQGMAPAAAPGMPGGGPPAGAEFILAHTGELRLTDAQVVRLAAIARRATDRHEQMRTAMMQRMRQGPATPPSADERQRMMQSFQQERDQAHADLRDAIAVLTADQQARAWEMVAMMHRPGEGRPAFRSRAPRDGAGSRRGGMMPGRAPGGRGGPGAGAPPPPPNGGAPQAPSR